MKTQISQTQAPAKKEHSTLEKEHSTLKKEHSTLKKEHSTLKITREIAPNRLSIDNQLIINQQARPFLRGGAVLFKKTKPIRKRLLLKFKQKNQRKNILFLYGQ